MIPAFHDDFSQIDVFLTKDINHYGNLVKQAELIIPRLEKITPDSSWAHKASGCRGSLIRLIELKGGASGSTRTVRDESIRLDDDFSVLKNALERSYEILEGAAAERLR